MFYDVFNMTKAELADLFGADYNPVHYSLPVEITPSQWGSTNNWNSVVEYFEETMHGLTHEEATFDVARFFMTGDSRTIIVWTKEGDKEQLFEDIKMFLDYC